MNLFRLFILFAFIPVLAPAVSMDEGINYRKVLEERVILRAIQAVGGECDKEQRWKTERALNPDPVARKNVGIDRVPINFRLLFTNPGFAQAFFASFPSAVDGNECGMAAERVRVALEDLKKYRSTGVLPEDVVFRKNCSGTTMDATGSMNDKIKVTDPNTGRRKEVSRVDLYPSIFSQLGNNLDPDRHYGVVAYGGVGGGGTCRNLRTLMVMQPAAIAKKSLAYAYNGVVPGEGTAFAKGYSYGLSQLEGCEDKHMNWFGDAEEGCSIGSVCSMAIQLGANIPGYTMDIFFDGDQKLPQGVLDGTANYKNLRKVHQTIMCIADGIGRMRVNIIQPKAKTAEALEEGLRAMSDFGGEGSVHGVVGTSRTTAELKYPEGQRARAELGSLEQHTEKLDVGGQLKVKGKKLAETRGDGTVVGFDKQGNVLSRGAVNDAIEDLKETPTVEPLRAPPALKMEPGHFSNMTQPAAQAISAESVSQQSPPADNGKQQLVAPSPEQDVSQNDNPEDDEEEAIPPLGSSQLAPALMASNDQPAVENTGHGLIGNTEPPVAPTSPRVAPTSAPTEAPTALPTSESDKLVSKLKSGGLKPGIYHGFEDPRDPKTACTFVVRMSNPVFNSNIEMVDVSYWLDKDVTVKGDGTRVVRGPILNYSFGQPGSFALSGYATDAGQLAKNTKVPVTVLGSDSVFKPGESLKLSGMQPYLRFAEERLTGNKVRILTADGRLTRPVSADTKLTLSKREFQMNAKLDSKGKVTSVTLGSELSEFTPSELKKNDSSQWTKPVPGFRTPRKSCQQLTWTDFPNASRESEKPRSPASPAASHMASP